MCTKVKKLKEKKIILRNETQEILFIFVRKKIKQEKKYIEVIINKKKKKKKYKTHKRIELLNINDQWRGVNLSSSYLASLRFH